MSKNWKKETVTVFKLYQLKLEMDQITESGISFYILAIFILTLEYKIFILF